MVAVGANETVIPASELKEAVRRIKQLEGALGRKSLENEILKAACSAFIELVFVHHLLDRIALGLWG